jgi:hypothetical protein
MIIPGQFGFNCPSGLREEAAILNFISEQKTYTGPIGTKLSRNVHWMVLYKDLVFCSDIKWKLAATAGLSLTLDAMGKVSQNASSLKPLGQFKRRRHLNISPYGPMLIYVLRWWPSWISNRHKKTETL